MSTMQRPSDEKLATLQFRIADPGAMPGYCRDRPDPELTPTIIGRYDLRPEGGRKRLEPKPYFWCCHCQKDNHWLGYGIVNETGRSYSIGKDCARSHYGVEFTRIQRNFQELSTRQGVLDRLARIGAAAAVVEGSVAAILRSPGLRALDAKRDEIARVHANLAFNLSAVANTGAVLQEDVQIRDAAAERRRADRLGDRDLKTPIFRSERNALGSLEGAALMRTQGDCRDVLLALRTALARAVALHRGDTNAVTTGELTKAVRAVEEAHAAALDGVAEARQAERFFGSRNLDRLERWSASFRDFTIARTTDGLEIQSPDRAGRTIARLGEISLPDLAGLDAPPLPVAGQPAPEPGARTASPASVAPAPAPAPPEPAPAASGAWRPDRVKRLRELWEGGMPATEIGRELGGLSRNAVVGKAKRLGLMTGSGK